MTEPLPEADSPVLAWLPVATLRRGPGSGSASGGLGRAWAPTEQKGKAVTGGKKMRLPHLEPPPHPMSHTQGPGGRGGPRLLLLQVRGSQPRHRPLCPGGLVWHLGLKVIR